MYFNNDIKINKFINKSDFNIYLNVMFRTDSSQRWTNELTPENECYTMGNPEDTGVFRLELKDREDIKNILFDQWKNDVDHLFFARVECPRDDIFEWNEYMHKEMRKILQDMISKHYYPVLIVTHTDQPKDSCHFHILLDYIDPDN